MDSTAHDEFLIALGRLVVSASTLEELLHDAILLTALGPRDSQFDGIVGALTARLSFRDLVDKFGAVCQEVKPPHLDVSAVREYCTALEQLNEQRNAVIHAAWLFGDFAGDVQRSRRAAKPKSGFSMNVEKVSVSEIEKLSAKYARAIANLWKLIRQMPSMPSAPAN